MYLFFIGGACVVLYFYLKFIYSYWERKGIPSPGSHFIFGNMLDAVRLKKNPGQIYSSYYKEYDGYDFFGFYKFMTPAIVLRSPELIKNVFIQNFDHFQSNDFDIGDHDAISSRNPFLQSGPEWKKTRSLITPAFTSGKLKSMVPLTQKASNNMIEYIAANLSLSKAGGFVARDLFIKYTADNAASCAFGLEANSFNPNKDEFMRMGQKVFDTNWTRAIKFMLITNFPNITRMFNIQFIPCDVTGYYRDILLQTLKYRKEASVERNDFLNQMSQIRKKLADDEEFGITDVLAHSIQFIVNGMESSSTTMGFAFYLIAKHLDVQKKMREEIDLVLEKHNGEITYDAIKEMEYLDQVLNESLRMFPAAAVSSKRCTKEYTIPKTDKTPEVTLKVGTPILIPTGALHLDEQYFPNPEKFDPDRFTTQNSQNIQKGTYLPFGEGPRICLGQRFAIIQVKLGIARLLKEFEVRLNKQTIEPIELSPRSFLSKPVNPICLNFFKRGECNN